MRSPILASRLTDRQTDRETDTETSKTERERAVRSVGAERMKTTPAVALL